jgi:hypothetical protein
MLFIVVGKGSAPVPLLAFLRKASHCHTESRRTKREGREEVFVVVLADREGLAEKPGPTTLNKLGNP